MVAVQESHALSVDHLTRQFESHLDDGLSHTPTK